MSWGDCPECGFGACVCGFKHHADTTEHCPRCSNAANYDILKDNNYLHVRIKGARFFHLCMACGWRKDVGLIE